MKLVYTHENRFLVSNAKNILDRAGLETLYKNEYAVGAGGDLAVFDTWLEVWVVNDKDYAQAFELIENAFNHQNNEPWICRYCKESNEPNFEFCWNCEKEK